MPYFSPAFFKFFEQLEHNNHKEWFDTHRAVYENEVKEPFKRFVSHIISTLSKEQPDLCKEVSKCIFRINRDIRFAKDKSPYKNHVGAVFSRAGTKDTLPGYYLHIGAKELFIGGGMYEVDKTQLEKIRQEIMYNPVAFKRLITDKAFANTYGTLKGEQAKILPPEYKEFAKEQPLIANKQFYYMTELAREDVLANDFDKIVLTHFKAAAKVNDFLRHAVTE